MEQYEKSLTMTGTIRTLRKSIVKKVFCFFGRNYNNGGNQAAQQQNEIESAEVDDDGIELSILPYQADKTRPTNDVFGKELS